MPEQRVRLLFFGMPDKNVFVDDLFRLYDPHSRKIDIAQAFPEVTIMVLEYRTGDQSFDRLPLDLPALAVSVADGYGYLLVEPDAANQVFLGARRFDQFEIQQVAV